MEKSKKIITKNCDLCEIELKEPLYTNDGIDRREYFHDKNIELCYKCSCKLLKKLNLSQDKYQELFDEIKEANNYDLILKEAIIDNLNTLDELKNKYNI